MTHSTKNEIDVTKEIIRLMEKYGHKKDAVKMKERLQELLKDNTT
jgi:hypothetical protein